ncbi:hypothetical protein LCGC14_2369750 [marine sediment metagenome]|uniref:Uncharacterized protein n=1 Tax=marine sediment metagenome TaxID=412755 RepID=A0A0F9C3Z7_9ZZZZ
MTIKAIMGDKQEVIILGFVTDGDACAIIVDEDNVIRPVSLTYTNDEPVFKLKEITDEH